MALQGAQERSARPSRKLIAAYLRVLGSRRLATDARGFRHLRDRLEPRLRALVADALGVRPEQLDPETSLSEDLAADSLDLLDVVVRIEDELDLVVPEREIGAITTYGDLVDAAVALLACRMRAADEGDAVSSPVEVRIGDGEAPRFVRVLGRDPYDQEVLRDDLRAAGARTVEVRGSAAAPSAALERSLVRARLAGADVCAGEPSPISEGETADVPSWPASRLVTASLTLIDELREECGVSLQRLVARTAIGTADLTDRRRATNERIATFRAVVETYLAVADDVRAILHAAARELGRLDLVRRAVDERAMRPDEVAAAFDSIADALLCYVHALQSQEAWTRTRLPPRAISRPLAAPSDAQELRA